MRKLAVLATIWGFSFLFIKVAGEGMTPPTVAGLRVALGCATLLVVLRVTGGHLPSGRTTWMHLALVSIFANALPFSLLAWAEQDISSALTAVLNASTPLFAAASSWAILHERLRPPQLAGLLVGVVGVGVTAGVGAGDVAGSTLVGSAAAVGAGACYGLALAWSKRHLMGLPATSAAAGQLLCASLWLAPVALGTSLVDGFDPTPSRVASILLLGCVGTGLAFVLYYQLVNEIGATRTSLVTYLVPVVAVVVGALVLDETLSLRQVLGAVLIVGGIRLVNGPLGGGPGAPEGEEAGEFGAPPPRRGLRRWRRGRAGTAGPATAAAALVLGLPLLAACSGSSGASQGCGDPVRERLDPSSSVHLVTTADEPDYLSDPPTSGAHYAVPAPTGVSDDALPRPLQVTVVEAGLVLVQYQPDELDADQVAALEALVADDDQVVVAPGPGLGDPVVATAWTWKLTCGSIDADPGAATEALADFAAERAGEAPGADTGAG